MDKDKILTMAREKYNNGTKLQEKVLLYNLFGLDAKYDTENRTCKVSCPVTELMLNSFGRVHGGVFSYISDTVMGLLNSHFKEGSFVTLELKTSFLKGIGEGELIAIASYVKEGSQVNFVECEIYNQDHDKLCVTTGTFMAFKHKKS